MDNFDNDKCKQKILELKKKLNFANIELDIQKNHFQRLDDFSKLLNSELEMDMLLHVLIQNLKEILNFDYGLVFIKDDENKFIDYSKAVESHTIKINKLDELEDVFKKIDENKKAIIKIDTDTDKEFGKIFGADFDSWMAVPIVYKSNVNAVIILLSDIKGVFTKREEEVAISLANQAGIAIENANLFEKYKKKNKELEEALERLKKAQEQIISAEKISAASSLINGMANKISNPLTGMLTSIQMIKSDILSVEDKYIQDEIKDNLSILEEGTRNIKLFISKLVAVNNTKEVKKQNFLISEAINISKNVLYEEINNDIEIEENYKIDPQINANFPEIIKLFTIIFYNSKEALNNIEKNNKKIKIDVYENRLKQYIEISDNGKGMDSKTLSQVFKPFFTTKMDEDSLGVGLYIGYDIVKKNFIDMSIQSKLDVGTTVKIELSKSS